MLDRTDPKIRASLAAINLDNSTKFDTSFLQRFTDVEFTFIGWLLAQLLHAEGLLTHDVLTGYDVAIGSLKQRLVVAGRDGTAVKHLKSYFDNIRRWSKIKHDVHKILSRPDTKPVYTENGPGWWSIAVRSYASTRFSSVPELTPNSPMTISMKASRNLHEGLSCLEDGLPARPNRR